MATNCETYPIYFVGIEDGEIAPVELIELGLPGIHCRYILRRITEVLDGGLDSDGLKILADCLIELRVIWHGRGTSHERKLKLLAILCHHAIRASFVSCVGQKLFALPGSR